jgi:hypothetical protein
VVHADHLHGRHFDVDRVEVAPWLWVQLRFKQPLVVAGVRARQHRGATSERERGDAQQVLLPPVRLNVTPQALQQLMVTRFAASLRTDNSPQPKEAQPMSHALTSD